MWYIRLGSHDEKRRCWMIDDIGCQDTFGVDSWPDIEDILEEFEKYECDDACSDVRLLGFFWAFGNENDKEDADWCYESNITNDTLKTFGTTYEKEKAKWTRLANRSLQTPENKPGQYVRAIYTYCIAW